MEKTALAYLNKNSVLNMGMITAVRRGTAEIIAVSETGVCLIEQKSNNIMLSVDDFETGVQMLHHIRTFDYFTLHQSFMVAYTAEKYDIAVQGTCYMAAYLKQEPPPAAALLHIKQLAPKDIGLMMEYYHNPFTDKHYIENRLAEGCVYGGFASQEGNDLAGFIGIHEEGSMGMLHVLEPYQNRGYGQALVRFLTRKILVETGIPPYGQIFDDNLYSIQFHRKLGFDISKETICFMF